MNGGIQMNNESSDERKANQAGAYQMWHPNRDERQEYIKEHNRARVARELQQAKKEPELKLKSKDGDKKINELYEILGVRRTSGKNSTK